MTERCDELCVHCGACVGQCPRGALVSKPPTFEVRLLAKRCVGCGLCLDACGYGALEPERLPRTGTEGP